MKLIHFIRPFYIVNVHSSKGGEGYIPEGAIIDPNGAFLTFDDSFM